MASINVDVDEERMLTTVIVEGMLADGEIIAAIRPYWSAGRPTPNLLIDSTNGTWSDIPTEDIKRSIGTSKGPAGEGKTALVFADATDYGIGRMIEAYCMMAGYDSQHQCFYDTESAELWLLSNSE